VARHVVLLNTTWTERYKKRYTDLAPPDQQSADRVALAIMKGETTPGMRVRPIQPEKVFYEARLDDGDRIIFRMSDGMIYFEDIVSHDEIGRYGKR